MSKIYGYCRISRKEQNIERQERNIRKAYPDAIIRKEAFTGTKLEGRKELALILKAAKEGDTIVFDSVSRMSRNAAEGIALYDELMARGIELVYLKEQHISTQTYKAAAAKTIDATGNRVVDAILDGVNKALEILRHAQIEQAFEQAQKEVDDLHQRVKEGLQTAKLHGAEIGGAREAGKDSTASKKASDAMRKIRKYSKDFEGTLTDIECMKIVGVARNTYYKYKKAITEA